MMIPIAILGIIVVVLQATVDKSVTLELTRFCFFASTMVIPVVGLAVVAHNYLLLSRDAANPSKERTNRLNNYKNWVIKGIGRSILAALMLAVFGYYIISILVPYAGGEVSQKSATVLSLITERQRFSRDSILIRCKLYVDLAIEGSSEDHTLCFRWGNSSHDQLSRFELRRNQQVELLVRSNMFGTYVESISAIDSEGASVAAAPHSR